MTIPVGELFDFVRESNRIEGIHRTPTSSELEATEAFVGLPAIIVTDIEGLVSVYQPDAVLRNKFGLNVRVGNHVAPPGGPKIREALENILADAYRGIDGNTHHSWKLNGSPFDIHRRYETLHPFTDGNGRSGRAIWLWQMNKLYGRAPLGFLHHFYYQALERVGGSLP